MIHVLMRTSFSPISQFFGFFEPPTRDDYIRIGFFKKNWQNTLPVPPYPPKTRIVVPFIYMSSFPNLMSANGWRSPAGREVDLRCNVLLAVLPPLPLQPIMRVLRLATLAELTSGTREPVRALGVDARIGCGNDASNRNSLCLERSRNCL